MKVGRPKEEVAVSVYPDKELPTSNFPYVGAVEVPVPPLPMPSACERVSAPLLAKLDVAVAPKNAVFADMAVEDARGNVEAAVVDVAVNLGPTTVLYAVTMPRNNELPATSKIFPVVVVALAPTSTTCVGLEV